MKCLNCEAELKIKKGQRYHYVESGLDNVYLDGISIYCCGNCGLEVPEIGNVKNLHLCIALHLIEKPSRLSGNELRFLRKSLGMKSREVALKLGYEPEVFSRLENDKSPVGQQGDRLIRLWFITRKSKEIEGYKSLLELTEAFDKIKNGGTFWRIEINMDSMLQNLGLPKSEPIDQLVH